jgi:threonine/homoserine/homoserine lactone efflux protein
MFSSLGSFVVVVGLLTLTPGMDTALILRTAAVGAPRRAWGVVLGIQSGTLVWGVLTSAGVTALLSASHVAYETLRWVGACYLIWMGLTMLWSARRRAIPTDGARQVRPGVSLCDAGCSDVAAARPAGPEPGRRVGHAEAEGVSAGGLLAGWRRGVLTNLLNPKMGAFYVALLPQFIPAGAPVFGYGVLLSGVHIALGVCWSALLVLLARRLRGVLARPVARRVLDRVTGTVIAGFGVRLAVGVHL